MKASSDDNETKAKKFLQDRAKRAIAVRSKDREFHGLEREFANHQADMLAEYEKSKDIKHPRDVGASREEILREFLTVSGLLPKRYAVSTSSARVVSPTGHMSREIDMLLYDPLDSVILMNRQSVYQVYPVESVYGVIQVKSRLNKKEIKDGMANIASFKSLSKPPVQKGGFVLRQGGREERGFGLLFAYDSDLKWKEIVDEVESFAKSQPQRNWCNGVFILSQGVILYGSGNAGATTNGELESIADLTMFGFPDRQNLCLSQFYGTLMELLRKTDIRPPCLDNYYRLPLIAGSHSYEYALGPFAEFGHCEKHGDYQRKISAESLTKLIEWCRKADTINPIKAIDLAYGKPGDDETAYAMQPGDVRIYNPDNLELSKILVSPVKTQGLTFDHIRTEGMLIYIPYYYSDKEGIIPGCQKCSKPSKQSKKAKVGGDAY